MSEVFNTVFSNHSFLSAFFQIVILIFVGFVFTRKDILEGSGKKTLSALIWKLAVPCFAFNAFMQDFEWQTFKSSLVEFVLSVFFYILLIVIGKLIFLKKGKAASTVSSFFMAIGQTTLFSMPILQSVYETHGEEVMLYISTISIVFRIFVYIVAISVISGEKINPQNFTSSIKKVFLTPVMIGMFLGISVFLMQNIKGCSFLRLDKSIPVFYVTVKSLSKLVSPLCMIMIGMSIGEASLTECLKDKTAWIIAFLRNILAPLLIGFCCVIIHKTGLYRFNEYSLMALLIGFSAPVSVTLSIACVQYKKEEILASRACVISTLMTIVTFPAAFVFGHILLVQFF